MAPTADTMLEWGDLGCSMTSPVSSQFISCAAI